MRYIHTKDRRGVIAESWLKDWVNYHYSRVSMVESLEDVYLLMRFGEACVRHTFAEIPEGELFKAIMRLKTRKANQEEKVVPLQYHPEWKNSGKYWTSQDGNRVIRKTDQGHYIATWWHNGNYLAKWKMIRNESDACKASFRGFRNSTKGLMP